MSIFYAKPYSYIIKGLLAIAALIFDYFINIKTLNFFAQVINANVYFIAFVFLILDCCVAILASGIVAFLGSKAWKIVLWLLAIIKLTFFIIFISALGQTLQNIIITMIVYSLLIILIYAILHFAGEGLAYILALGFFGLLKFLGNNPETLRIKRKKLCNSFNESATGLNVPINIVRTYFNLDKIC